jgi:hypothetical protein
MNELRERSLMRRLDKLEGTFQGRTLLVVSCGPSASQWKRVRSTLAKDAVIACVKQAVFLCGNEAEIHFYNAFNCQRYFPHNRKALKVYVEDEESPVNFNFSDLSFTIDPATCKGLESCVAATGRFGDYTIDKTGLIKPWGPGIMHEIVIYLALHLGFREVHTVGWDVAREAQWSDDIPTPLEHFYDTQSTAQPTPVVEYEWLTAKPMIYKTRAFARHVMGNKYNCMPDTDKMGEVPVIVQSLPGFLSWINSQQVSIKIHTLLNDRIINPDVRSHVVDLTN